MENNVKDLLDALIDADLTICCLCRRLNPQHADCTFCDDHNERINLIKLSKGEIK